MDSRRLATDCLDLVLARSCARCGRLGRSLCIDCLGALRGRIIATPLDRGRLPAFAALPYDGPGRDLVIAYKEHGNRALAPILGVLLADAVEAAARSLRTPRLQLVPVPAHRRSVRGFDALGGIVRAARPLLAERGFCVSVVRAVCSSGDATAMKSLTGTQRRAHATHLFRASRRSVRPGVCVVVVDDVLTTGSTVLAMTATLAGIGTTVASVAAVTSVERAGQPG